MYVILEGVDGCGKSTQIELLKDRFKDAIFTKEPGGTKFGIAARELLLHSEIKSSKAELLLFLADRAEHFLEVVKPNIGNMVVSDRGFLSGMAYAMVAGFELQWLSKLNRFALDNTLPNKSIIFQISKEELISRVGSREQDKIEQRGYDYLMQIQDNLVDVAEFMKIDYKLIDATKSIEEINSEIIEYILL